MSDHDLLDDELFRLRDDLRNSNGHAGGGVDGATDADVREHAEGVGEEAAYSRPCFLAAISLASVRLPIPEMSDVLIADVACSACTALLHGRPGRAEGEHPLEEWDRLAGIAGGDSVPGGWLDRLGLTSESLARDLNEALAELGLGERSAPRQGTRSADPLRPADGGGGATQRLEEIRGLDAARVGGRRSELAELSQRLLARRLGELAAALAHGGPARAALIDLATDPDSMRGLAWGRGFLERLIEHCTTRATRTAPALDLSAIAERVERQERQRRTLGQVAAREASSLAGRLRRLWRLIKSPRDAPPYSAETLRRARRLEQQQRALDAELRELTSRAVLLHLEPMFSSGVAQALRGHRDELWIPVVHGAALVLERLEGDAVQARSRLAAPPDSPTTQNLRADRLLDRMRIRLHEDYEPDRDLVEHLLGDGIVRGGRRMTLTTFVRPSIDGALCAADLHSFFRDRRRVSLEHLALGWRLPEARELLTECARILELGLTPRLAQDRAALGEQGIHGFLLVPGGIELPTPFGVRVGILPRLASEDPLTFTAVGAEYGIPPNGLSNVGVIYDAYRWRFGDRAQAPDPQRYPLHVFRDGWTFDEPYAPAGLGFPGRGYQDLVDLARSLGLVEDETLQLDVRPVEASAAVLHADPNVRVELVRKMIERLAADGGASPEARLILHRPGLASLRRLYDSEHGVDAGS